MTVLLTVRRCCGPVFSITTYVVGDKTGRVLAVRS